MIVCLYVIQFTRYRKLACCGRACVRRELLYISTSFRICQELFSSFFKFLFDVNCAPGFRRSSHNFLMISHQVHFVKKFFSCFLNFFVLSCCPRGQLAYISTSISICQALFYKFRNSFLCILFMDIRPYLVDFFLSLQ